MQSFMAIHAPFKKLSLTGVIAGQTFSNKLQYIWAQRVGRRGTMKIFKHILLNLLTA